GNGDLIDEPLTAGVLERILLTQLAPLRNDIAAIKPHGVSQKNLSDVVGPLKDEVNDLIK
ncbi:unnamed protein product, partial [Prorocentrum cordatum]